MIIMFLCTHPKHMDRKQLSQHASTKLFHTQVYVKNTHELQTVGYFCEGK